MHTTSPIQLGRFSRHFLSAALLVLALGAGAPARAALAAGSPYGWPVKPFDQPHPIRGSFGDPRTMFAGPPTERTLLAGAGSFQFHDGVDISAPDGTPAYPVESGTVKAVTSEKIVVDTGSRAFEYWHLVAAVTVGQHVDADVTVLGHVRRSCGHVHLTELEAGVPVNPLAIGHLTPYEDASTPVTTSVSFRKSVTDSDLMPEFLGGRLEIVANIHDFPSMPVRGTWHDLPVTPALVEWRIQRATDRKVLVPTRVAYDVRDHLPPLSDFWRVYARGTHQNMSVFGQHYSYMQPGAYLVRLAPGGFDTRTLPDGVYEVVVTATDIRGNHSSYTQRFSVHNRPGA